MQCASRQRLPSLNYDLMGRRFPELNISKNRYFNVMRMMKHNLKHMTTKSRRGHSPMGLDAALQWRHCARTKSSPAAHEHRTAFASMLERVPVPW
jgi:hypothetical protein